MRDYKRLRVTAVAMEVAEAAYQATRFFPSDERFGLTSQMRRSALSIGSNIAEGCGRGTDPQLLHFLGTASGSASELEYQCLISMRLGFGERGDLARLADLTEQARRMLYRLESRIRSQRIADSR